MDKNTWVDIKTIFFNAVELDGKEREVYLTGVCKTPEIKKRNCNFYFQHTINQITFLKNPLFLLNQL